MIYIYLIINKVNGKTYVGQRKSSKEWYEDRYMGSGTLLKKAKQKYGIENFEKFLIQYCYSKEETDKAERFWIAEYRRRGKAEYNIANGGDGGSPNKGRHFSDEWKRKISEAKKGKQASEETRRKLSEVHKGENNSMYGKHHSEESRRKMSEVRKGENNPMHGKHHSEESRRKMSESRKGKHCSEEIKRKISEAMKGKHRSEETRRKMSESMKGKHHSEETRRKMSESMKGKHWKLVDGKRVYYR